MLTDTYNQVAILEYDSEYGPAVTAIKNDIYLFVQTESNTIILLKYNTITNEVLELNNVPQIIQTTGIGRITSINTNIYLFGTHINTYIAYKYDTTTNTYTQLASPPYRITTLNDMNAIDTIDDDIYLQLGSGSSYVIYKYNTITDTYTRVASIPYDDNFDLFLINDYNLYMFSVSATYKYDIQRKIFTRMPNTPNNVNLYSGMQGTKIGATAYIGCDFNGNSYYTYLYNMSASYENNNIYYEMNPKYKVSLTKSLSVYFSKAFIYKDDKIQEYPCYWGDGSKWNLIEE